MSELEPPSIPALEQLGLSFVRIDVMGQPLHLGDKDAAGVRDPRFMRPGHISRPNPHPIRFRHIFWVATTPVTQAQWVELMATNPSRFHDESDAGQRPVEMVSYYDALDFIDRLNQRTQDSQGVFALPSEAEWEVACLGGLTSSEFMETNLPNWHDLAWSIHDAGGQTRPVGAKTPNGYGLHDTLGNVWEWVEDSWHNDYDTIPPDGSARVHTGLAEWKMFRGGSWREPWALPVQRGHGTPLVRRLPLSDRLRVLLGVPGLFSRRPRHAAFIDEDPRIGHSDIGFRLVWRPVDEGRREPVE